MSMEEWPDDRLDELFRKSAEETEHPFNPADWADMARRLDQHDRQRWVDQLNRWRGLITLLLLVLGLLGWRYYDTNQQPGQPLVAPDHYNRATSLVPGGNDGSVPSRPSVAGQPKTTQADQPTPPSAASDPDAVHNTQPRTDDRTAGTDAPRLPVGNGPLQPTGSRSRTYGQIAGPATEAGPAQPAPDLVHSLKPASSRVSAEAKATRQRGPTKTQQSVLSVGDNRAISQRITAAYRPQATTGDRSGESALGAATPGPASPRGAPGWQNVLESNEVAGRWLPALVPLVSKSELVQTILSPAVTIAPVAAIVPGQSRLQAVKLPRLSIMVMASPDLSSIGLKNFDRPGANAGISVQYQLTDRVSLHTGAMLSNKRYQASPEAYSVPASVGYMHQKPLSVEGMCRMIDLPINLRYDWLLRSIGEGRPPARWFVSVGATSYFFQREIYTYKFADPSDPTIKATDWDNQRAGVPGGSFGFSNLNASLGYERPITRRLSWQVEPFIKIPLREVGSFRVRLVSTGAFVGLRYRFR